MNAKQILAVTAVVLFALCLVPSADANPSITGDPSETLVFDNLNGGNIPFEVTSDSSFTMDVEVTNRANGDVVYTGTVDIVTGVNNVSIHVSGLDAGTYTLHVVCSSEEVTFDVPYQFNVSVNVETNILSNWATYAVIIVVIIVIVIFAYLKMRDTPKKKPEMTFEELEAQRKADMAEKAEKRQKKEKAPAASSTERKRYVGGSKTEKVEKVREEKPVKEKKVKEEKPKMTFEELEAQKQAEKAAKAEKKKSTGLTERERYLEEKRKKKEQE